MENRRDAPAVMTCVRVGDMLAAVCDEGRPAPGATVRVRFLNGLEGRGRASDPSAGWEPGSVIRSEWLEDRTGCPLCGEGGDRSSAPFQVLQLFWQVPVMECERCGLLYKGAVPTGRLSRHIYSGEYVHFAGGNQDLRMLASRVLRLGPPIGRHLDYGCGRGDFVRAAALAGWDSAGADPFLAAPSAAAPRLIRFDAADGPPCDLGSFDVISAWAVAEHLSRPLDTFRGLVGLLRPGGRLIFNSPNGASLAARRSGPSWTMATLLEHLAFFTPRAVGWMAAELGLRLTRLRRAGTPFPLGTTRGGAVEQGIVDLPVLAQAIEPAEGRLGPVPVSAPSLVQVIYRALLSGGGTGPPARVARAALDLLRLGDHLEATLAR